MAAHSGYGMGMQSYTYREISEKTGVNIAIISKILHDINEEARFEIKGWLNELMPLEYKKSLLLNQYIHKKQWKWQRQLKTNVYAVRPWVSSPFLFAMLVYREVCHIVAHVLLVMFLYRTFIVY
jgi:hypothetical protein